MYGNTKSLTKCCRKGPSGEVTLPGALFYLPPNGPRPPLCMLGTLRCCSSSALSVTPYRVMLVLVRLEGSREAACVMGRKEGGSVWK